MEPPTFNLMKIDMIRLESASGTRMGVFSTLCLPMSGKERSLGVGPELISV